MGMIHVDGQRYSPRIHGGLGLLDASKAWMEGNCLVVDGPVDLQRGARIFVNIRASAVWCFLDVEIHGEVVCHDAFRTQGRVSIHGWVKAPRIYFGHDVSVHGGIITSINEGQIHCGNNCFVNGTLEASELRCGDGFRAEAHLRSMRVFAGNHFVSTGRIEVPESFMGGAHVQLVGSNYVERLMTRDMLTVNGGDYGEIHTDDQFRSTGSIFCRKLIVDNTPRIEGDVHASEYIRFGDSAYVRGNVECRGLVEKGPGLHIDGSSRAQEWRDIPASSEKRRG